MHIITITDDFPPLIGGMAVHAWELSRACVKRGNAVTVLTAVDIMQRRPWFHNETIQMHDGVQVIRIGFPLFLRRWYRPWISFSIRRHIRWISRFSPLTVLHVHEFRRPPHIRQLSSLPLVWTNHSSMFLEAFEKKEERGELQRIVNVCDRITAPSRELVEKTIACGFPASRAVYIPNGVDSERFVPAAQRKCERQINGRIVKFFPEKCVILCARRYSPKNGLHVYLEALSRLSESIVSQAIFLFAGSSLNEDDSYAMRIRERINELSVRMECYQLGAVANQDMPALYQASDFTVLPSLAEATSISGLEAMASGLPILGTRIGGIPEIVDNEKTGILVKSEDSDALAIGLGALITDVHRRKIMGEAARKKVEAEFCWSAIADRFCGVFKECGKNISTKRARETI